MISTESALNDLGIDAVTGVELMDWLGISTFDLSDPQRFSKLSSVIEYLKDFPTDTQRYLVKRAVNNKNVDKLQHVWEYTGLLKNKRAVEEALEKIKVEGSALGSDSDPVIRMAHAQREIEAKDALNAVQTEIRLYE
jgi:hypothetical protein